MYIFPEKVFDLFKFGTIRKKKLMYIYIFICAEYRAGGSAFCFPLILTKILT